MAVVHIINKQSSTDDSIMRLVRRFVLATLSQLTAYHPHPIADCISVLPTPQQNADTRVTCTGSLEDLTEVTFILLAAIMHVVQNWYTTEHGRCCCKDFQKFHLCLVTSYPRYTMQLYCAPILKWKLTK